MKMELDKRLEEVLRALHAREISPEAAEARIEQAGLARRKLALTPAASVNLAEAPAAVRLSNGTTDVRTRTVRAEAEAGTAPTAEPISRQTVLDELTESLAQALYMAPSNLRPQVPFIELGLDSVIGVEWIRTINRRYQLALTATKLYDFPCLEEFADFVHRELRSRQPRAAAIPSTHPVESHSVSAKPAAPYGLVLSTVHALEELTLGPWTVPPPRAGEVTIEVKASAINFPDTMCVRGLYPTMPDYPFVPGFEVSGVITKLGEGVDGFAVGQEIIGVTGERLGGHAGEVNVPAVSVARKPANLSFEEACTLPVAYLTVAYAFGLAQLSAGEHVLIHTATGGCGLLAIQLANLAGAVCHGSSSKAEKLRLLRDMGIGHAIDYNSDFSAPLSEHTEGRGVDVVLNTLAGDARQRSLDCLAPSGRYLEIAVHALRASGKLDLTRLTSNQSFFSIDLRRLGPHGARFCAEALPRMTRMAEAGELVPIVSRVYPIHQIREALEYVERAEHIGKVVVSHTMSTVEDWRDRCVDRMLEQRKLASERARAQRSEARALPRGQPRNDAAGTKDASDCTQAPMLARVPAADEHAIAVVGVAGTFPESANVAELWRNIVKRRDCIREVPPWRWSVEQFFDPAHSPGKTYSKWMGVVEQADHFDPLFFNISPADAESMDPQQCLFLQSCWECIEDAAIAPGDLSGSRCGVFVGVAAGNHAAASAKPFSAQGLAGDSAAILAARVSYLLNLKGPCISIDTACSSSLVALAQACDSLVLNRCDIALAGGVCVLGGPGLHIMTAQAGMLSRTGRCYTFDQRADGFVPAEGVGVVLLKRLADAVRDEDPIHCVLRGWGVNQDGKTNGITAPSVSSQTALELEVYQRFGIHPESITLVEAHGTGTALGDPIEVEALTAAFRQYTDKKTYCAIGSVKSNIGHALAAAGMAGLIKVIQALRHRVLPPTLHVERVNENIVLDDGPFYVNSGLKPWFPPPGMPRRAAVSAFGFSGTNAHVVVEEYSGASVGAKHPSRSLAPQPVLFVLSARSREQLARYARLVATHLESEPTVDLADAAYTMQVGREAMEHRFACVSESGEHLIRALRGLEQGILIAGAETAIARARPDGPEIRVADRPLQEIAKLWVSGARVDWRGLYGATRPARISLPGCPLTRERDRPAPASHPLLGIAGSGDANPRFSTTFVGSESFLSDHVLNGRRLLPAVAYLEMARAGLARIASESARPHVHACLRHVVWPAALEVAEQPVTAHLTFSRQPSGELAFEIGSDVIHSSGSCGWEEMGDVPVLDLTTLRERAARRQLGAQQCYEIFQGMGFDYGAAHRAIASVAYGTDAGGEPFVLAQLRLPAVVADTAADFVLHPSLMDAALQALVGWMLEDAGAGEPARAWVPFALERLEVWGPCPASAWAVIRRRARDRGEFDIDVCDERGQVCARLAGFSLRSLMPTPGRMREAARATPVAGHPLREIAERCVRTQLVAVLKVPPDRIDPQAPLEKYGLDSIRATQMTRELENVFGALPKTLFFEYHTLEELAGYLIEAHADALTQLLPAESAADASRPEAQSPASTPPRNVMVLATPPVESAAAGSESALDIAIIGIAGRYPQSRTLPQFWENLISGKDCVTEIPAHFWRHEAYFDVRRGQPGKMYSRWGGFLDGVDEFDSLFFNISPREAELMDPQERLFLQCVYHTLEDAGYTRESLRKCERFGLPGSVGVFVGVMYEEYQLHGAQLQMRGQPVALTGSPSSIANRVSHCFDLHGPSMAVDTMCSSSLTAIHLACRSLVQGECELAIAGGVNVSIHPNKYLVLSQGQFASSTGRCASFGAGGDGYVPGEGVGAVLLKPLSRAIADGDRIQGVIKASAVNHGGRSSGYTVPDPVSQASVIAQAIAQSGLSASDITYVEAHGTGTELGDPIEIAGLTRAFAQYTNEKQFCAVGSVKSNIGHCESAAGIAALTKVLLQMKYGMLVPSLHADSLNPHIDFENSPFRVQRTLEPWSAGRARVAGISAFGAGGSNAHLIVQEYTGTTTRARTEDSAAHPCIFVLSARDDERLHEQVTQFLRAIEESNFSDADLPSIAYTLQVGREPMDSRVGVIAASIEELRAILQQFLDGALAVEGLYCSRTRNSRDALGLFSSDEDLQAAVESWAAKRKHSKLLQLWVNGVSFDWNCLYGPNRPARIGLPGYPFARERHWIASDTGAVAPVASGMLHPLVHTNTSNLAQQCFSAVFTGSEPVVADHVVRGEKLLPAAASLEMAHEAFARSVAGGIDPSSHVVLKNLGWLRPLGVKDAAVTVQIVLRPEVSGEVRIEIVSAPGETVHFQCHAMLVAARERPVLELSTLQGAVERRLEGGVTPSCRSSGCNTAHRSMPWRRSVSAQTGRAAASYSAGCRCRSHLARGASTTGCTLQSWIRQCRPHWGGSLLKRPRRGGEPRPSRRCRLRWMSSKSWLPFLRKPGPSSGRMPPAALAFASSISMCATRRGACACASRA